MSKNSVFEKDEKQALAETLFNCALVFRAPLKAFEDVKSYLLRFTPAELIFQKISTEYIWISKTPPKEDQQK